MKTVRTHLKTKLLFILALALSIMAAAAFGQKPLTETPQIYGDSSLTEFDLDFYKNLPVIKIHADTDLVEVVSTVIGDSLATYYHDIVAGKIITIPLKTIHGIYLKTKRGVTSVYFYKGIGGDDGFVLLNGKLVATYNHLGFIHDLRERPEDLFKDVVKWEWSEERSN